MCESRLEKLPSSNEMGLISMRAEKSIFKGKVVLVIYRGKHTYIFSHRVFRGLGRKQYYKAKS